MGKKIEKNWDFTKMPKLAEFIKSEAPFPLVVGSFGCGKTMALITKHVRYAVKYPGSRSLMIRSTYSDLKASTMIDYASFFGLTPSTLHKHPMIESFNRQDNMVVYKNGSILKFQSAEGDRALDQLKGQNISAAMVDQLELIDKRFFDDLTSRIRYLDIPHFIASIANPLGKNWNYLTWMLKQKDNPDYPSWVMTTEENPFLDSGYIERMKQDKDPRWIARNINCSFDEWEGLIYNEYREDVHVIDDYMPEPWQQVFYGVDLGWSDPSVVLAATKDEHGNIIIFDELYKSELTPSKLLQEMRKMGVKPNSYVYIDPQYAQRRQESSGESIKMQFERMGQSLIRANNQIYSGIMRIKEFLQVKNGEHPYNFNVDKCSNLYITKKCRNLIAEMQCYLWSSKITDMPDQRTEHHALDALKYLINTHSSLEAPNQKPKEEPFDYFFWNSHNNNNIDWRSI